VRDPVDSTGDCVFCGIVAGTIPCAKVAEDATTFAFMDIDPGSEGHPLVIPKRHTAPGMPADADAIAERARVLAAAL
jgi:histidine triad (HIT) family protein